MTEEAKKESKEPEKGNGSVVKDERRGWLGDTIVVEVLNDEWAVERITVSGKVIHKAKGKIGNKLPNSNSNTPYVFVCWQKERIVKALGSEMFGNRSIIDLYQLSWVLAASGEIPKRSLESVVRWCTANGDPNTVDGRVHLVGDSYFRVLDRLKLGLEIEGVGREIVSKVTDEAGTIVNRLLSAFAKGAERKTS